MKTKILKGLIYSVTIIIILYVIAHFNLFSSFNLITARLDKFNGNLVYPQCEFRGKDLDKLNTAASTIGFSAVYVDCELFYTNGMDSYYEIMDDVFTEKYGNNWLEKLHELNRKN